MRKHSADWFQSRLRLGRRRHKISLLRKSKGFTRARVITLTPPSDLSFRRRYNETCEFLDLFRESTLLRSRRTSVHVDLTAVDNISVPVAIVLAAEFDRWRRNKGVRLRIADAENWSPKVRVLLSDLGVFDLLKVKEPRHSEANEIDNVTLTPLQSGLRLDGEKLSSLQTGFRSILEGLTTNAGVYEGLSEAVENAISHAYPGNHKPKYPYAGHRWWGAGCLELGSMRLRFFVFDQGEGIPFTLPSNHLYEDIRAWLAKHSEGLIPNDTVMLRAALETGRTRTGASHRGLGLRRMADVVEGTGFGYLRIISRRGEIVYHSGGSIETRNHSQSVGGTLIEWCLPADALIPMGEGSDEDD